MSQIRTLHKLLDQFHQPLLVKRLVRIEPRKVHVLSRVAPQMWQVPPGSPHYGPCSFSQATNTYHINYSRMMLNSMQIRPHGWPQEDQSLTKRRA